MGGLLVGDPHRTIEKNPEVLSPGEILAILKNKFEFVFLKDDSTQQWKISSPPTFVVILV